ncbi:hypothetical protein [Cupriavidus numazuensis]|uniref:Replication protein O n=1 Tax=Cupriavidus numazuensis TaxID=221992 RepID=A0ABM8TNC7_9BURK|nr:hypothetical protein [Cupriavidus numazuensis]CAG2155372.1 hypothetical protein LMG26411_04914 [Cupriavidus numazuensis]
MSIAQHSVAGEAGIRLDAVSTATFSDPTSTPPLSSDNTNLPWIILRAVHRASRVDGLPTRARAVLAALARTVDAKRPYAEIFARRTLLSERAMQSERTFYRSLTDLETAGLIDRRPQRRYVDHGLFGRAYLHLTERAAVLLGLVEDSAKETAQAQAQPLTQPTATVADGANTKDLSPSVFQKRQPGGFSAAKQPNQLPADLQRLRTLGFGDFLIFRLMREARERNQRLSDVVEVCWTSLRKAAHPINYLRALLGSTTDFSHQLRARLVEQQAAQAAAEERASAVGIVRGLDGQRFVDALGETQYAIAEGGQTLTVHHAQESAARQAAGDWATGFVRALQAGQIVPVTETEVKPSLPTPRSHREVPVSSPTPQARVLTKQAATHLTMLRELFRRGA